MLKRIDVSALATLSRYSPRIDDLAGSVQATLDRRRRVFLCGCGATGRLELSLEALWRGNGGNGDRVQSLMAGGDAALVHALEGFEEGMKSKVALPNHSVWDQEAKVLCVAIPFWKV